MLKKTNQAVPRIPADYGSLTPYVIVRGAAAFLDFLQAAFGAVERVRVPNADGTIGHGEVRLGDRVLMTFDARPEWPETPAFLTHYVNDIDAAHARALAAGAVTVTALEATPNAFGDRGSRVRDPFGNLWWLQSHLEDVDEATMGRRMSEPAYQAQMRHAQESLDHELRGRRGESGGD